VLEIVSSAAAVTEAVLLVHEPLYAALDEAGLPPAEVVAVADTVVDFVHGFAIAEGAQPPGYPFNRRELLERLETVDANVLPTTMRRIFRALTTDEARYYFDRGFDAGLGILLKGIEATAVDADRFGEDPL
jgi:hypothetical protein